jgi:uncharacterized delta-60 repeat protein
MQRTSPIVLLAALSIGLLARGVAHATYCCSIEFARQRDGKIIEPGGGVGYQALTRRTPGGALDSTFGVDGVTAPVEGLPPNSSFMSAVAVLPDDRIVAVGWTSEPLNHNRKLLLVRFNADGSLDTGFGEGGFTVLAPLFEQDDFAGPDDVTDIVGAAARPGGGVVVVVDGEILPEDFAGVVVVVAADGTREVNLGPPYFRRFDAEDVVVQPDDEIVVLAGRVLRLHPDGTVDAEFNPQFDLGPEATLLYSVVLQPDGKLAVAGAAGVAPNGTDAQHPFLDLGIARLLPGGELDETFGEGGKRITPLLNPEEPNEELDDERIERLVLQCDGKLLAKGGGALMRYTPWGAIDTTFAAGDTTYGVEGVTTCNLEVLDPTCTLVEPPVCDCCNIDYEPRRGNVKFARQSGGRIIELGPPRNADGSAQAYFAVSGRTPDGALDPSFGVDGVTAPIDGLPSAGPAALAILPDDEIVAVGESLDEHFVRRLVLVRYNADGSLDTEFGEGGFSELGPFSWENGEIHGLDIADVAARPGGGVVVTLPFDPASDHFFHLVAVIAPNGTIDPTFGPPVSSDGYPTAVAVQPDDKTVVLHGGRAWGRITRWDTDGTRDENFGSEGNGSVDAALGPAGDVWHALVIQPDGKLVVAGEVGLSFVFPDLYSDLAILRLLPDGTFDETFGEGGKRITTFGDDFEALTNLVLQCDGKLVALGSTGNDGEGDDGKPVRGPFLIRYTSSGDVDTAYGVDGVATCKSNPPCLFTPPVCESPPTTVTTTTSTTSTTQPGPECPATCDDADACTTDACEGGQCVHTPLGGVAAVLCVCEQAAIAECAGEDVPPFVLGQAERACRVLERLADATSKKQQKILGKAARRWQGAAQLLARPKQSSKVSAECATALQSFLADAATRAAGARASVRRPLSP